MKDLSHIFMLEEIKQQFGPVSFGPYVLLFNTNRISKEEAIRVLESGEYSPYVLLLSKSQMDGLFYDIEQPSFSGSEDPTGKEG